MVKVLIVIGIVALYCLLFCVFEYLNATNMTGGSWSSIIKFALRPYVFLFFGLSSILVWGLNKELYEVLGKQFWFTGIILNLVEFVAFLVGCYLFYKKMPTTKETIALGLMLVAIIIASQK